MEQSDILTLLSIVAVVVFLAQTLKQGRWRVPQLIGLALVIVALGGYVAYRHREQTRKAQEQAARRAELNNVKYEFEVAREKLNAKVAKLESLWPIRFFTWVASLLN